MKPQVEEVEDDLAAEEENKLINEVRPAPIIPVIVYLLFDRNIKHGGCIDASLSYSSSYPLIKRTI